MIDLHIHSTHSDGTDSVSEILKKAEDKKLEIISITDHDSIDAYFELENNPILLSLFSGNIITGCEFKTFYNGVSIEVLGYGFDYKKIQMPKVKSEEIQALYVEYLKTILDKYEFVYDSAELYIDFNNPNKHFAGYVVAYEILRHEENEELVRKIGGFTANDFFRTQQCDKNSIFYIDESKYYLSIDQIIDIIHSAGGLAFLAHPYIYNVADHDDFILSIIANTNIDGLECIYPLFSIEQRNKILEFAKKYNKFVSGGTDYHAKNKPTIELGTGINQNVDIPSDFIKEWFDKSRTL